MQKQLAKFISILFLVLLVQPIVVCYKAQADDYSFDLSSFKPRRLETNYNLDLRPGFSFYNESSRFYKLTNSADKPRRSQQNHSILTEMGGHYLLGDNSKYNFAALSTIKRFAGQTSDNHVLNESYLSFDIDSRLRLGIGKKTFKWGKGYSWNPVNLAGRQKDLNDLELALSGYTMIYSQYNRTMEGPLSNLSLTTALIPVGEDLNHSFARDKGWFFANQLYMLIRNTDVDLYLLTGYAGQNSYGIDFSRNLASNHEIHGEIAVKEEDKQYSINGAGLLTAETRRTTNYLIGTRYLDYREITYILEYLHNGSGFTQDDLQNYYNSADRALLTNNKANMKKSAYYFNQFINKQFGMQDYLYFKVSKPELFDDLYLKGSVFTVYNLHDKSFMSSVELNYTALTDQIFTFRITGNQGNNNSEFGQKVSDAKVEIRYKYFF
ncbi:MAG: hypothetical protein ACQETH_06135 [Candidatus Rifleibacteriota bacterium]